MSKQRIGYKPVKSFFIFFFICLALLAGVLFVRFTMIKDADLDDMVIVNYIFTLSTILVCCVLYMTLIYDNTSPINRILIFSVLVLLTALGSTFLLINTVLNYFNANKALIIIFELSYKAIIYMVFYLAWQLFRYTIFPDIEIKSLKNINTAEFITFIVGMLVTIILAIISILVKGLTFTINAIDLYIDLFNIFPLILLLLFLFAVLKNKHSKDYNGTLIFYFIGAATLLVVPIFQKSGGYIFFGMSLLFCCVRFNFYHSISKEYVYNKLEIARLETKAMANQIRPHFLYNSLTSIMGIEDCGKETRQAIASFGDYLRGNLNSIDSNEPVSFEKEMDFVTNYVFLEKLRFGDKINVDYDVQFTTFELPALSIQILVENAIKHGSLNLKKKLFVNVKVIKKKSKVYVTVEDNGVGFDTKKSIDSSHTGLRNLKKRIEMVCQGELIINSVINKGTKATLIIPIKKGRK